MKAIIFSEHGGPEVLRYADVLDELARTKCWFASGRVR